MRILLICVLSMFILVDNIPYDMTEVGWARATEQCAPFGGLVSADESNAWKVMTDETVIKAKCRSSLTVRKTYKGK